MATSVGISVKHCHLIAFNFKLKRLRVVDLDVIILGPFTAVVVVWQSCDFNSRSEVCGSLTARSEHEVQKAVSNTQKYTAWGGVSKNFEPQRQYLFFEKEYFLKQFSGNFSIKKCLCELTSSMLNIMILLDSRPMMIKSIEMKRN